MTKYKIGLLFLLVLLGCSSVSSNIKKEYILQNNLGAHYIKLGLWHDAKIHLLKALEVAPQKAFIYNNLGIVYEYFNQKDKAKEFYQEAVKLEPKTLIYQKNLICFAQELLGTTTTINQVSKKTPSDKRIETDKIIIKKIVEPKLKVNQIKRVATFAFSEDKEALEISQQITELFKISIVEESPFYIIEDYEIKDLTNEEVITQQDLEKSSKVIALNKILSSDGLFIIKMNKFKDMRFKDFEIKKYYSEEKKEFVYYHQPYIKRNVGINLTISFLEGTTGNLLWNNEYEDEVSTSYLGDDEETIPLFDKQLFEEIIKKAVFDFISDTTPQERIYERIVVMEK